MELQDFITRMTQEVNLLAQHNINQSRAFLKWFLINYFRLDDDIAEYHICDNQNDKGIDGIYSDDLVNTIYIFQSKYSPNPGNAQGDADLRDFFGVRAWFQLPGNIDSLDNSLANAELKTIINGLDLKDKLDQNWSINLIFLTNKIFDVNGNEYLSVAGSDFDGWDLNKLFNSYTYAAKDKPVIGSFSFNIDSDRIIHYQLPNEIEVFVFAANAFDITKLDGIQNGSLFDKNVRYWLGNTRINREITKTISIPSEHDKFMLYNNGITLIAEKADYNKNNDKKLEVVNYAVVNGCQTVLTLYQNKNVLDDTMKLFVKIVKTGQNEELTKRITRYNNNQNSIGPRDLKSNDKLQQDIQKQFFDYFGNTVLYNIKRGEPDAGYAIVIPNDFAAQMITAFVLKEPYTTHQKTEIFTDKYNQIFNRHIDPPLVFLLYQMYQKLNGVCFTIKNSGARDYKTTRFFFMYLFRNILDDDPVGQQLITDADSFFKKYSDRYQSAFDSLAKLLVVCFDYYVSLKEKNGQWFDYKNVLRNVTDTQEMALQMLSTYKTSLVLHPDAQFSHLIGAEK